MTPGALDITYPALLDFPAPALSGYPRETVIAEKFQSMVYLRTLNSRMKDFYDVWLLARQFAFDGSVLAKAIAATFANRETAIDVEPIARQFVPDAAELTATPEERADPIGDHVHSPVKGIVHRYPDRVLLKPTHACAVYCRFCFRREMVGPGAEGLDTGELAAALDYIRAHYNRSAQKDPPFFMNLLRSSKEVEDNRTNALAKMMVPLDRFFTDFGARMEERRRREGVYPPKEIITPSPMDSSIAFSNYIADAQLRLQHDMQLPNEPKRIRPGEDVRIIDNKISVQGQVAVMSINGLLTKTIFDANPTNAFYVEESFPLDWMFPYLTPYGIIMKINRNPVPEFSQDMLNKDHEFWSKYSERLIGNWITYDTPVTNLCEFAERVYLRRDFKKFAGSPMFVRDDNAQKAFSKLRSAIGGLYFWRFG